VGKYVVEPDGDHGSVIAWDGGDQGEVYIIHIDSAGSVIEGPTLLTEEGEHPSMKLNPGGNLHVSWLRDVSFYYMSVSLSNLEAGSETQVVIPTHISLGLTGDSLDGPVLAYEDGWVYIFWSIHSTTDTEAGISTTEYVIFPEDEVQPRSPTALRMLGVEDHPYYPY